MTDPPYTLIASTLRAALAALADPEPGSWRDAQWRQTHKLVQDFASALGRRDPTFNRAKFVEECVGFE